MLIKRKKWRQKIKQMSIRKGIDAYFKVELFNSFKYLPSLALSDLKGKIVTQLVDIKN